MSGMSVNKVLVMKRAELYAVAYDAVRKLELLDELLLALRLDIPDAEVSKLRAQLEGAKLGKDVGVVEAAISGTGAHSGDQYVGIGDLELSVRSYNLLTTAGVRTVKQLAGMTRRQLRGIKRMGKCSIKNITLALRDVGLTLADDKEEKEV